MANLFPSTQCRPREPSWSKFVSHRVVFCCIKVFFWKQGFIGKIPVALNPDSLSPKMRWLLKKNSFYFLYADFIGRKEEKSGCCILCEEPKTVYGYDCACNIRRREVKCLYQSYLVSKGRVIVLIILEKTGYYWPDRCLTICKEFLLNYAFR